MNLTPDDPKLTAYALGELDATERAAVEAALARSPECSRAVAEIRALGTDLTTTLAADTATAAFTPVGRDSVEPLLERNEVSAASISARPVPSQEARFARASSVGKWGSTESRPTDAPGKGMVIFLPWRHWRTLGMAAAAALVVGFFVTKVWRQEPAVPLAKVELRETIPLNQSNQTALPVPGTPLIFSTSNVAESATNAVITVRGTNGSVGVVSLTDTTVTGTAAPGSGQVVFSVPVVPSSPDGKVILGGQFTSFNGVNRASVARLNADGTLDSTFDPIRDANPKRTHEVAVTMKWNEATRTLPPPRDYYRYQESTSGSTAFYAGVSPGSVPDTNSSVTWSFRPDTRTTAAYPRYVENPFTLVASEPLSTFSTDVDTASYANVRRFLNQNQLPPRDAVRIEELLNYFTYAYAPPTGEHPFAAHVEIAGCPWAPEHRLVRVGLKGRELKADKRPPSNFVFLIDVSGSMAPVTRLPLIKQSLRALVKRMTENDRVAMVVYASSSGTVLESTSAVNKEVILAAIDRLEAGGSTNGGEGIQRAYDLAVANFIKGGVNRVLLCTDGDFNVGITDRGQLLKLIEEKAKSGVFFTTLGVGDDNFKDATLQQLADKGNGNYHYLDSVEEGHKVLVEQMNATLVTIAKDVKIQIEFNPAQASAYRLIGYEKRILAKQDFNNDAKDAGEIGAGHTVTALYEVVPPGVPVRGAVDPLKYQVNTENTAPSKIDELAARLKRNLAELEALKAKLEKRQTRPAEMKIATRTAAELHEVRTALVKEVDELKRANPVDGVRVARNEEVIRALDISLGKLGPLRTELLTLKLRYKAPDGDKSTLMEIPVTDSGAKLARASADFKFASAVAEFGMLLKDSPFKGTATFDSALELAQEGKGNDTHGYRSEFINLLGKAKALKK